MKAKRLQPSQEKALVIVKSSRNLQKFRLKLLSVLLFRPSRFGSGTWRSPTSSSPPSATGSWPPTGGRSTRNPGGCPSKLPLKVISAINIYLEMISSISISWKEKIYVSKFISAISRLWRRYTNKNKISKGNILHFICALSRYFYTTFYFMSRFILPNA